jgi:BCD family chlorophyll transporter-like MFS transporter
VASITKNGVAAITAPSAPVTAEAQAQTAEASAPGNVSMLRNIKLGTFHIGSSMADILTSGVWNRIAINELGLAATPVALLISLKYFIAPLSIWVGQRSDVTQWRGYRRLPYIWSGRALMVISYFLLGLATLVLADNFTRGHLLASLGLPGIEVVSQPVTEVVWGWLGLAASFLTFSLGSALSGTTFLSLVYDVTPQAQRTRVISVIWFFLILGFAGAGVLYGRLLPEYTREGFLAMFIIAPLIMGGLWVISMVGEENPNAVLAQTAPAQAKERPFWVDAREAWSNVQTRLFFAYLSLSTLFFYTQDVILEPFGARVFDMSVAHTSRFSAYWGSMALIGIVVSLLVAKRFPKSVNNMSLSRWSLIVLVVGFGLFLISALFLVRPLVTVALVVMGVGLGMWTVGGLGLMMDMTRAFGAGLYLALWTVASTLARGSGTVLGGVLKDMGIALTGQANLAYGLVFLVQVVGLVVCYVVLKNVDVDLFQRQTAPSAETVMTSRMD